MVEGPGYQAGDVGHQTSAELREGIFYAGRYLGILAALYQAVALEALQRLRKHLRRDVGYRLADGVEPRRFVLGENTQYQHLPFPGEPRDDVPILFL